MECYVGLDVHSKASVFVIRDGHGRVMAQGALAATPEEFRRWYDAQHSCASRRRRSTRDRDIEPTRRRSDQQAEQQSDDRLHLASIPPRPPLPPPAIRSSR